MKLFAESTLGKRGKGLGRGVTIVILAVALLGGTVAKAGKKEIDMDFSGDSASATPTPAPPRFNVPIPVGHDARGVKIPYFDGRGRLQMYFAIAKAMRLDLRNLEMKNAFMQTYDEKEVPDASVFMTRSVLDLDTRIVTSDVPVTVRRSDFQIVGQKMVFNTQTRMGHMTGGVRMIIFNRQEMSSSSPTPSKSSSPHPSATP